MSQFLIFYGLKQAWYRPDANGYTDMVLEAGRFPHEEAVEYANRGKCFVVEDGSDEMLMLCNKWERCFLPKMAANVAKVERLTAERDAAVRERDALALICAEVIKNLGIENDDDPAHLPNHAADVSADKSAGWNAWKKEAAEHDETEKKLSSAERERDEVVGALKVMLRRHGWLKSVVPKPAPYSPK